MYVLVVAER